VISEASATELADYLAFRHFYRHSYSFVIDWNELQKLVVRVQTVWATVKKEFEKFAASLVP